MKLSHFKKLIDIAVGNANGSDPTIDVAVGGKVYAIKSIGQFSIVPDVTIHLEEEAGKKHP